MHTPRALHHDLTERSLAHSLIFPATLTFSQKALLPREEQKLDPAVRVGNSHLFNTISWGVVIEHNFSTFDLIVAIDAEYGYRKIQIHTWF